MITLVDNKITLIIRVNWLNNAVQRIIYIKCLYNHLFIWFLFINWMNTIFFDIDKLISLYWALLIKQIIRKYAKRDGYYDWEKRRRMANGEE